MQLCSRVCDAHMEEAGKGKLNARFFAPRAAQYLLYQPALCRSLGFILNVFGRRHQGLGREEAARLRL